MTTKRLTDEQIAELDRLLSKHVHAGVRCGAARMSTDPDQAKIDEADREWRESREAVHAFVASRSSPSPGDRVREALEKIAKGGCRSRTWMSGCYLTCRDRGPEPWCVGCTAEDGLSASPSPDSSPPSVLADAALLLRRSDPDIAAGLDALIRSWPSSPSPGDLTSDPGGNK